MEAVATPVVTNDRLSAVELSFLTTLGAVCGLYHAESPIVTVVPRHALIVRV